MRDPLGSLDTTALSGPLEPVGPGDAAAQDRRRRSSSRSARSMALFVAACVVLVTAVVVAAMAARSDTSLGEAAGDPVVLGSLAAAVVLGLLVWLGLSWASRSADRRSRRLTAFAERNGMTYQHHRDQAELLPPTAFFVQIFGEPQRRLVSDVVVDHRTRHVEHGQATVMRGGDENGAMREPWGYVAVRTAVPLPHVAILRRRGLRRRVRRFRGLRDLQRGLPRLPGFDRRFVVLCPPEHESDVAAIATPDLLDRWAEGSFDVEILGSWLVLFRRRPVVTLKPKRWRELAAMTSLLDARLTDWERRAALPPLVEQ
ncbi:hypothetical protein G6553_14645 [Nocardioides sp. IC4_145]|uniref:hypothetical protein n=1 Tax=Nocardioides sp. IC4_145 TaxID=2714037 RepID=UPI00140D18AA|nr:hypothetical protein [Nocardioides sp. IC4_145]NHC24406.1 hypothetical protein [Nocardioides sp. IC4_145]